MKSKTLIALAILFNTTALTAQEIPTPDYSARPYYLKSDNTLENLERADAASDAKVKGAGFGGVEMYFSAFGARSPLRFTASSLPRMFIKLDSNVDPAESITLAKAEVKKDRRRFLQGSMSVSGAARNTSGHEVKLQFKKIREGIFEIIIPPTIEAGEYAFMPMGDQNISITSVTNIKISCFGIDGGATGGNTGNSTPVASSNSTVPSGNTASNSTPSTTPQPDFDNVIYYFNQTENTLVDLERAINTKSENTFGFLNLNNAVSIKGVNSPVTVPASSQGFVVRLSDGTDPYTLIELMPCAPNSAKQTREYSPAAKKDQPAQTTIAIKLKRLSGNTYMITPIQPLALGEYFFVNKALKEKSIFAFKVE
ncbi:MAG: hypothetical protein KIS94_02310 [Chitinophagales bacterium]|nr:hypothetical protein [Chitinophagales bacterium]